MNEEEKASTNKDLMQAYTRAASYGRCAGTLEERAGNAFIADRDDLADTLKALAKEFRGWEKEEAAIADECRVSLGIKVRKKLGR